MAPRSIRDPSRVERRDQEVAGLQRGLMTEIETAIADNRAAVEEFVAAARGVDAASWNRPRAEGKWSPAQVTEHLAIVYEYNRKVVLGTAGKGAPKFLQPLAR